MQQFMKVSMVHALLLATQTGAVGVAEGVEDSSVVEGEIEPNSVDDVEAVVGTAEDEVVLVRCRLLSVNDRRRSCFIGWI